MQARDIQPTAAAARGLETRHVSGSRYVCPLFSFYFTLLMFICTFPATSTHCQVTRSCLRPQPCVSTHQHPFWTHRDLFAPPTLVFTHKHPFFPTSTRFRLRTPPFHPPEPRFWPTGTPFRVFDTPWPVLDLQGPVYAPSHVSQPTCTLFDLQHPHESQRESQLSWSRVAAQSMGVGHFFLNTVHR